MQISAIGLDVAKNVFQVHGVDREGRAVLRRKLRRERLLELVAEFHRSGADQHILSGDPAQGLPPPWSTSAKERLRSL